MARRGCYCCCCGDGDVAEELLAEEGHRETSCLAGGIHKGLHLEAGQAWT